jgi:hypothetical protein
VWAGSGWASVDATGVRVLDHVAMSETDEAVTAARYQQLNERFLGATCFSGPATAMRALADALVEAADLADAYDADPDAFNQREQGERDPDH